MREDNGEDIKRNRLKRKEVVDFETIKRKKNFYDRLKSAIDQTPDASLWKIFNKMDRNKSGDLDKNELRTMFEKM